MAKILNILRNKKTVKTYTSIDDLPIYNWFKISETNDLNWLLLDKEDAKYTDDELLTPFWENIRAQFFDTFGIPEKMRKVMELRLDNRLLSMEMTQNGDMSLETFVDINKHKITQLLKDEEKQTSEMVTAYIEKFLRFPLNEKVVSVKKYYTYVKMLENSQKPIARAIISEDDGGE